MDLERHHARLADARVTLGGCCARCGTQERLEFDHIDPATKRQKVTRMHTYSDVAFWAEVAKCQLLCRPCHVDKSVQEGSMDAGTYHGSRTGYRKRKCRCDACKAWNHALYEKRKARLVT